MGVFYKLSRCGVWGTMFRWLQAYLKDRPSKVFKEGSYSSERIARSGVPQGAVLTPLLFNIMMYDMLVEKGICSSSMEVKANIFPLSIHRDLLTCQYDSKLQQLPNEIADNLLEAQLPSKGVSLTLLPSMTSRARALFTNVNLQILSHDAAPLVSPLPPWFDKIINRIKYSIRQPGTSSRKLLPMLYKNRSISTA
ncbi:Reverse transcriptase domain [Trinorchestia longiramus]|nr:Reverse transcriptase domain [Trinorchestia longiramus]